MARYEFISATPIIKAVEARGGFGLVSDNRKIDHTDRARLERAFHRAREAGQTTIENADRLCVELLGEHPFQIFGDDWFEPVWASDALDGAGTR